jgi:4-alpha-glucanotransferase
VELQRASGILLHPTSLPGPFGIGDLGPSAYAFIDFLKQSGQTYWQTLPLGPTGYGDSPYQCFSAFAGKTTLISPEQLVEWGLLSTDEMGSHSFETDRVDYGPVIEYKSRLIHLAFENFKARDFADLRGQFEEFRGSAAEWLDDYALYRALKDAHGGASWNTWDHKLAARNARAIRSAKHDLKNSIEAHEFYQFLFFKQWLTLKQYCNQNGIKIIGDMPIFVAHDSADVWVHRNLFKLDDNGLPTVVAGVPPDYFSPTGQRWGNPLYDWHAMKDEGFRWWIARLREAFKIADIARIDHFRGFVACWEIPAQDETAERGQWIEVPGREMFSAVKRQVHDPAIIAEDLGMITPEVHALREELGFPGMRVLQFAFGGDPRDLHLPHNYVRNTSVYTGTHDSDTVTGWFNSYGGAGSVRDAEQIGRERRYCLDYLNSDGSQIHWDFVRAAMASVADLAIIPLQDLLGLDSSARMNTPASDRGNWSWRFKEGDLNDELRERLKDITQLYGRTPWSHP